MATQLKGGEFYGRRMLTRTLNGLVLADVRYPERVQIPRHSHERAYFCLIRRGSYTEQYGRRARVCRPLSVVFHPPGERHAEKMSSNLVASFNVEVPGDLLDRVRESNGPLDQPAEFCDGEVTSLALRLFREFASGDEDANLSIESLTLEILAAFAPAQSLTPAGRQSQWATTARDFLESSFRERVTLRRVAQVAGVHPVHLAVTFRRFHGCSVGEFLRRQRIAHARRKLVESQNSLAEIALESGFTDQSHMTHMFKRFTGKTPGEYRAFLRYKTTSQPNV